MPSQLRDIVFVHVVHVIKGRRIEAQKRPQDRLPKLAHMGPHTQAVLPSGFKDLFSLGCRKRSPVAENIHELGELPLGGLRNHLLTDGLHVVL